MNAGKEYYGCVTKVEHLWCLEEMGIPNTCVLEAREAYPGYYGSDPGQQRPRLIFFMSTRKYSLEEISRMTAAVRAVFGDPFDAAYCEITMGEKHAGGVRIKGIEDYAKIHELQAIYEQCGLELKKKDGVIENVEGLIMVKKFFRLVEVAPDIFIDADQQHVAYFGIKEDLPWDRFTTLITRMRNNWNGKSFDAAKSYIYRNAEICDLVRIYARDIDPGFVMLIRDAYLKAASYR